MGVCCDKANAEKSNQEVPKKKVSPRLMSSSSILNTTAPAEIEIQVPSEEVRETKDVE
jgi:hypothetical protein